MEFEPRCDYMHGTANHVFTTLPTKKQKIPDRTSRQPQTQASVPVLLRGRTQDRAPAAATSSSVDTGSGAGRLAGAKTERSVGGATTGGWRTKQLQEGESMPPQTGPGAGGCSPQTTHQSGTPQQDTNTATPCTKGSEGPRQQQGRAGTGLDNACQQQRGHDW